ncbi:MAG TPA: hypothetical protein VKA26_05840 [Ignavibacteriaceae bacterium]|nr:hypothetical protein [Ignavibacteriaceae bacterium]
MVSLTALWLPIVVSAAAVFIVSSLIHTVLGYHNSDFGKLSDQDKFMDAVRPLNIAPGDYMVPNCDPKERNSDSFKEKLKSGPVVLMTVYPNQEFKMGSSLVLWFIFSLVIGVFAAYISGHALSAGANYLSVFRFAGCTAFASYSLAVFPQSIWYKTSWKTTFKNVFDGLVYALVTAGVFGWLWPAGM